MKSRTHPEHPGEEDPADALRERFSELPPAVLEGITAVVERHAALIAEEFYANQTSQPETSNFLSHALVEERLRPALERWLIQLFRSRTPEDFAQQVQRQREVAAVHARIGVTVHMVNSAMRVIKRELGKLIGASGFHRLQIAQAVQGMNDILDQALLLMNDVYLTQLIDYKRNEQSFRLYSMGQNVEAEGHRVRVALFDWLRVVLTQFHGFDARELVSLPALAKSDFGLWLTHKAKLVLAEAPEIDKVIALVDSLDATLRTAAAQWGGLVPRERAEVVRSLNDTVNNISVLVESMVQRALEFAGGRDALTHLLNRRYLPPLIQREVNVSIQRGLRFAVVLLDLDHFKVINDNHGHEAGDIVLRHVAEIVTSHVRAADFVFRYGGEEILVLIAEVSADQAYRIAETLRRAVAGASIRLSDGRVISVTTSIGIAVHDGHPDYQRVVSAADQALYQAKDAGRNRCVMAEGGH